MKKLLKYENMKLKQQFIFNLPATQEVCGRVCPGCYAAKAQVRFPKTVLTSRERLLEATKQPDFVNRIVDELSSSRRSTKTVRIHESGEFHSQAYINKWVDIASRLPDITFYAFTKRLKDFDFTSLMSKPNVVIIDSLKHDRLNYGKPAYLATHPTAFTCPATVKATADSTVCGISCRYCMTKQAQNEGVKFVQH